MRRTLTVFAASFMLAGAAVAATSPTADQAEMSSSVEFLGNDQLPEGAAPYPYAPVQRSVAGVYVPVAHAVSADWPAAPVQRMVRGVAVPPR